MPKKTIIEGYSVICFVDTKDEADDVRQLIKRHVAPTANLLCLDVEAQTRLECEHCHSMWTERSETYNGGCCDEDGKNNPANVRAA